MEADAKTLKRAAGGSTFWLDFFAGQTSAPGEKLQRTRCTFERLALMHRSHHRRRKSRRRIPAEAGHAELDACFVVALVVAFRSTPLLGIRLGGFGHLEQRQPRAVALLVGSPRLAQNKQKFLSPRTPVRLHSVFGFLCKAFYARWVRTLIISKPCLTSALGAG